MTSNRSPFADARPTIDFTNEADQVDVQIAFGYYKGAPVAAMFHKDLLILIPRIVLQLAVDEGWEDKADGSN